MLFQLMATAIMFAVAADGWLVPHVLATAAGGDAAGEAAQVVAAAWLGVWVLQLVLLSRYSTSPEDLEECASERLRLAVEASGSAAGTPLVTVEQEAAALLALPEAVPAGGAVPASFMVARTAVYMWLFVGLEVAFVNHHVIGYLIALVALPVHILVLPPVWGYLLDDSQKGLLTCCCRKSGPNP